MFIGALKVWSGVRPFSKAAAIVNALKVDPAW